MQYILESGAVRVYGDGGEVIAEILFRDCGDGFVDIYRTFVSDVLRGQGVAGVLMEKAVAEIFKSEKKIVPSCSYAKKWLEKNVEFSHMV